MLAVAEVNELVLVGFCDEVCGDHEEKNPEWAAYLRRAAANARPCCSYCGAFISRQRSRECRDAYGEYDPECAPGKGCNRTSHNVTPARFEAAIADSVAISERESTDVTRSHNIQLQSRDERRGG